MPPGSPFLSEILEGQLYLSDMFAASDHVALRRHGITHVLCVAEEALDHGGKHPIAKRPDCTDITVADFEGVDLEDDGCSILEDALPNHINFIESALATPGGRCLVHCRLGMNRSATVVVGFLMFRRHMCFEDAWRHTVDRRPSIALHPDYQKKLRSLPSDWLSVSEVLDAQLYLSDMCAARDPIVLRQHCITHVLCVAEEALDIFGHHAIAKKPYCADITVADLEGAKLDNDGSSILKSALPKHIRFIDQALATLGGRCLVHCGLGTNRSAAVIIAFLMVRRRMSFADAWRHTADRRPNIAVHPEYQNTLQSLPDDWLACSSDEWQHKAGTDATTRQGKISGCCCRRRS